jgi:uncharacterized membrane protein YgaE (UPF0421/DUF939 family)
MGLQHEVAIDVQLERIVALELVQRIIFGLVLFTVTGEMEVLRMKAELEISQQKVEEPWKHLLQELEQTCKQAVSSSEKIEDELSECLNKQKLR